MAHSPVQPRHPFFSQGAEPALATHLFPLRMFGPVRGMSPLLNERGIDVARAIEVIQRFPPVLGSEFEVVLTRMGGLFVRIPTRFRRAGEDDDPFRDFDAKMEFVAGAASAMNLVICELALEGVWSEPASPRQISTGGLTATQGAIHSGGGGLNDRTVGPTVALIANPALLLRAQADDEEVVVRAGELRGARQLLSLGASLPDFVSSAYSLFNRRLLAEALLDAWIVIEQILNFLWKKEYESLARNSAHARRLIDARSFTANVRAELLLAIGILRGDLYDLVQRARKHRNDLAHGASVSVAAASDALMAMCGILELVLGRRVVRAQLPEFLTF